MDWLHPDRRAVEAAVRAADPRARLARPEDGPAIESLLDGLAALEWPDLPPDVGANVAAMLGRVETSFVIVVDNAGRIGAATCIHILPDMLAGAPQILVDDLFVDLKLRGKGFGGVLMRGVRGVADTVGAGRIFILLDPRNARGARLVEKHGLVAESDRLWAWTRQ
jgi:GNAT superfamily N-acetyltransferase